MPPLLLDKITREDSELVVDLIISDGLAGCDSPSAQVEHGEVPLIVKMLLVVIDVSRCQSGYYA